LCDGHFDLRMSELELQQTETNKTPFMQNLTMNPLKLKRFVQQFVCLMFMALMVFQARVRADEFPPGCSLASGGLGNTSAGGINFNLPQAHVGDTVPVFPNLGMVSGACQATNASGVVYIASTNGADRVLTNFLINVNLDPVISSTVRASTRVALLAPTI